MNRRVIGVRGLQSKLLLSFLLLLLACSQTQRVLADDASDAAAGELGDILAEIRQLSGRFRQTIYPESGGRASASTGEFHLQSPDRFLWRIDEPDNQLVVARGEHLWHYDADLDTATRRPASAAANTPMQVLAGDRESLARDFTVARNRDSSFTLVPRAPDAGFQSLELTLSGGMPVALAIVDRLSQRIEITFDALSTDAIDSSIFEFSPPEGADVFIHDA